MGVTFRFPVDPLPINATDISLQVVFRGTLGNETNAVVVSTKNIAEPNFVVVQNSTDYRRLSEDVIQEMPPDSGDIFTDVSIAFGSSPPPIKVATAPALPAPGHSQIAFLADLGTVKISIDLTPSKVLFGHPLIYAALPVSEDCLPVGGVGCGSTWPVSPVRGMY